MVVAQVLDSPHGPVVRGETLAGGMWLVELVGDVDLVCAEAITEVVEWGIEKGHRRLLVDLADATLMDCTALGALITALRPLRRLNDAAVVLVGATGATAQLLTALQIDALFDMHETRPTGVAHLVEVSCCEGWKAITAERPEPLLALLAATQR